MRVTCATSLVECTLSALREAGARDCECVMLWLGQPGRDKIEVMKAYRPTQNARADMFHIPRSGMSALYEELRRHRLMVAAQVHSHPGEAFHSEADDKWAIVRHQGALSLVVPKFALVTTVSSFLEDTKVYQFSSGARWTEVPRPELEQLWLKIT
jgi:proteasome lid subunit RPN8/RPN11